MRPMHQVLPYAFKYLVYPGVKKREGNMTTRICIALDYALDDDLIDAVEHAAAKEVVMAAVRELYPSEVYLRLAAMKAGLLPADNHSSYSTQYIEFRDNWLRALIEKEKAREQLPESPTPRNESTQ